MNAYEIGPDMRAKTTFVWVPHCIRCGCRFDVGGVPVNEIDPALVCGDCDLREKLRKDSDEFKYRATREKLRLAENNGSPDKWEVAKLEAQLARVERSLYNKGIDPRDL